MTSNDEKISREILYLSCQLGSPLTVEEIVDAMACDRDEIVDALIGMVQEGTMIAEPADEKMFFWANVRVEESQAAPV